MVQDGALSISKPMQAEWAVSSGAGLGPESRFSQDQVLLGTRLGRLRPFPGYRGVGLDSKKSKESKYFGPWYSWPPLDVSRRLGHTCHTQRQQHTCSWTPGPCHQGLREVSTLSPHLQAEVRVSLKSRHLICSFIA